MKPLAVADRQIEKDHYRIGFDDPLEMREARLPVEGGEIELPRLNELRQVQSLRAIVLALSFAYFSPFFRTAVAYTLLSM